MQIELKGRPFSHPQIVGKMSYWGNQGGRRSLSPIRGRGDRERGRSDGRAAEKFVNPSRSYPGINPPKPQLIGAASSNLSASNNSTYQNAPPPLFPSAAYTREEHLQSKQSSGSEPDHVVAEQLFPPGKTSDLQIRLNKAPNQRYIGMKLASHFCWVVWDFGGKYSIFSFFFLPLGLEYLIEIQHNTLKKMPNNYCCLLCDADIKVKKDPVDTVDLAKNHLKSTGHKLKYLVSKCVLLLLSSFNFINSLQSKHFPTIKRVHFGDKNTQNRGMLESLVDRITLQNVPMKVKIVIGLKLFKRKSQEIKTSIENSTHFV